MSESGPESAPTSVPAWVASGYARVCIYRLTQYAHNPLG
jgi:hypothetical protein